MTKRMLAALVALAGLFVASYLTLYKLGIIGTLSCSVGSCETVQLSRWATFLGLPVAVWGLGYYALVFTLAVVGTHERFADSRGLALALALVTGWGLIFSAWLTWLELFVIRAICQWCVVSAGLAGVLFAICVADWRQQFRASSSEFREGAPDSSAARDSSPDGRVSDAASEPVRH